jgi:hypothetical protein
MTLHLRVLIATFLAASVAGCAGGSTGTAPQSSSAVIAGSAAATVAAGGLLAVAAIVHERGAERFPFPLNRSVPARGGCDQTFVTAC